MHSFNIVDIDYQLGEKKINVSDTFADGERIVKTTGIKTLYETENDAEDLAYLTASRNLEKNNFSPNCIIYVTQSQKYILPGSSVLVHDRLKLNKNCAVFDINAGCSGFAQALLLASNLITMFEKILVVCADKYRGKLAKDDRSTNSVFSDAASSILIDNRKKIEIKKLVSQTAGQNHKMLIQQHNLENKRECLNMSGRELWNFTRLNVVPDIKSVIHSLEKANIPIKDIFIHQASKVVVNGIKNEIDGKYKFHENYENKGNTVSSTLPILLKDTNFDYNKAPFIMSGFGVGLLSYTMGIVCSDTN